MQRRVHDGFQFLLLASGLTVALSFVPHAGWLIYPFRLFVTFIHEGGHALLALLTGGWVTGLRIHLDASGETFSTGGVPLIIASAGYLASTIYGASLLALCRDGRHAKAVLTLTAVVRGSAVTKGRRRARTPSSKPRTSESSATSTSG